ncbi:MAG: glycosyltransferase family A protein [bacterium]|nr:glycosyltransferase family A protein [bacterium]
MKTKNTHNHKLVSVILPTFNGQSTIFRAISSIIKQNFKDWELIIVDDCSDDKTVKIIKDISSNDKRIKLIESNTNSGGPALPRTKAIKASVGEYIMFIDQDDMYLPNNISNKISYLEEHQEIEFITSLGWTYDTKRRKMLSIEAHAPLNWAVKRKVFDDLGYFMQEQNGVDEFGFFYRYLTKNNLDKVPLIEDPLTIYFRHENQNSITNARDPKIISQRYKSLLPNANQTTLNKKEKSKYFFRIGNYLCLDGNLKKGRQYLLKSYGLSPSPSSLLLFTTSLSSKSIYTKTEGFLRYLQNKVVKPIVMYKWLINKNISSKEIFKWISENEDTRNN